MSDQWVDPDEGPQQGTSTPAQQDPDGLWGSGPQQGTEDYTEQNPNTIWGDDR